MAEPIHTTQHIASSWGIGPPQESPFAARVPGTAAVLSHRPDLFGLRPVFAAAPVASIVTMKTGHDTRLRMTTATPPGRLTPAAECL